MSRYALLLGLAAFCLVVTPGCIGGTCRTGCNGEVIDLGAADIDDRQIFVDMTTIRIPEAEVTAILGDLREPSKGKALTITAEQAKTLLNACQAHDDVEIVQAPKLLSLAGQDSSLFIGETIRFASTEATKDGEYKIAEQEGSPVFLGYKLNMVTTPSEDGSVLAMDMHSHWRRQLKTNHSGEDIARMGAKAYVRDLTIEHREDETFEMANDGHVLMSSPEIMSDDAGRHLVVTVLNARISVPTGGIKPFKLDLDLE